MTMTTVITMLMMLMVDTDRVEQHIHFWLGEEASTDEAAIAAYKVPISITATNDNKDDNLSLWNLTSTWRGQPSSTGRCRVKKARGSILTTMTMIDRL